MMGRSRLPIMALGVAGSTLRSEHADRASYATDPSFAPSRHPSAEHRAWPCGTALRARQRARARGEGPDGAPPAPIRTDIRAGVRTAIRTDMRTGVTR